MGRAGAGPRRAGRGRCVPGAVGAADHRSSASLRTRAGRGAGEPAGRRGRQGAGPARRGGGSRFRPLDELGSARVDLLRGQVVFASSLGNDAPALLLKAAKRLEPLDAGLAREAYLSAWMAALFAGRMAAGGDLFEVCRAARALPPPAEPRTVDLVLDGLALIVTDGPAAAAPVLRRAVSAFADADITAEEAFRWGWLAQAAASVLWDDDAWRSLLVRQVRFARAAGVLDQLPVMLDTLGTAVAASGDFAAASALIAEADAICAVTGARAARLTAMMLAALRGRPAEAAPLIEDGHRRGRSRRTGNRGGLRALGGRHPAQRPRPLRGGAHGRPAGQRGNHRAAYRDAGAARARRGRRASRTGRARRAMPSSSWRRSRRRAATIPRSASRRAAGRCSAMTPMTCTAKRSTG